MSTRGCALLLAGLAMVLVAVTVAGFRVGQTPVELAVWGALGALAVLASAAAWVLLRDASDDIRRDE